MWSCRAKAGHPVRRDANNQMRLARSTGSSAFADADPTPGGAMSYLSCPTAAINAPIDLVWALLVTPDDWGSVFDVRLVGVDPPGPAVVGQVVHGETGFRMFHLKLTLRIREIDPGSHHLGLDVELPFGLGVREDIQCTPLDDSHCRVHYRCDFDFPAGWRGAAMRAVLGRRLDSGPADSLSRLKRAAERLFPG